MIEDYYGFSSNRGNTTGFGGQRSAQRTERSPRLLNRNLKSPVRTMKRTELSKEKLHSKDKYKSVVPRIPELNRN